MSILVEYSVTPLDKGESVGEYVARCIKVVERSGISFQVTSMGTMMEGETLRECLDVVEKCHEALEADCSRINAAVRIDYRAGPTGRLKENVESVEKVLGHEVAH